MRKLQGRLSRSRWEWDPLDCLELRQKKFSRQGLWHCDVSNASIFTADRSSRNKWTSLYHSILCNCVETSSMRLRKAVFVPRKREKTQHLAGDEKVFWLKFVAKPASRRKLPVLDFYSGISPGLGTLYMHLSFNKDKLCILNLKGPKHMFVQCKMSLLEKLRRICAPLTDHITVL